jgi:hypothetical protein
MPGCDTASSVALFPMLFYGKQDVEVSPPG